MRSERTFLRNQIRTHIRVAAPILAAGLAAVVVVVLLSALALPRSTAARVVLFIVVVVPAAALPGLIATLVVRSERERDRARHLRADTCPSCGYSLAGHVSRDQCPECGAPFDRTSLR